MLQIYKELLKLQSNGNKKAANHLEVRMTLGGAGRQGMSA